ncbi:MAG: hypothetical protein U0271_38450 [Polyangiaceae bacterium]
MAPVVVTVELDDCQTQPATTTVQIATTPLAVEQSDEEETEDEDAVDEDVEIDDAPASPRARRDQHHIWRGMTIAGAVVMPIGAAWIAVGAAMYLNDPVDDGWFDGIGRTYGTAFMTVGAIVSAVGIPLLIVGVANPGNHGRPPAPRIELSATGTGLTLSGSF